MRFKKTRWDKRETYTFDFDDGTRLTIRPGEDDVTEADIKLLHSMDDAEVYNNIKNSRPPMTEDQKAEKRVWEANHPGEKYPANWNLSLDYMAGEDGDDDKLDKSEVAAAASTTMVYDDESEEEMVERILDFLSSMQRHVYYLRHIKGYKGKEVAKLLNTSEANVSQRYKEALAKIEEKKENMQFFGRG